MALIDVSRTITIFQRLCQFAEEFTEEHRPELAKALTALFRSDLEGEGQQGEGQQGEGQQGLEAKEPVDVEGMIDGFLLRLRRARVRGKQVMKNKEVEDFRTTTASSLI